MYDSKRVQAMLEDSKCEMEDLYCHLEMTLAKTVAVRRHNAQLREELEEAKRVASLPPASTPEDSVVEDLSQIATRLEAAAKARKELAEEMHRFKEQLTS